MTLDANLWQRNTPGILDIYLTRTVPEGGPVGNFGISDVTSVIDASIMGFEQDARPLLNLANQRIDQGLASKEYEWFGGANGHCSDLHRARALGTWLEDNELADHHWNESRRYMEAAWISGVWTRQEIIRDGLDDYMALAVLGGVFADYKHGTDPFEAGIDMYEHWVGKKNISLKKALKPRELGYAMCRHYLNNEFDRADILVAGRRMLAAKLSQPQPYCDGWLENGQSYRAAIWLMLVYWYPAFHYEEELPTPVDVLLKAYDDMPDVTRPF
jgi:hypothetical protein